MSYGNNSSISVWFTYWESDRVRSRSITVHVHRVNAIRIRVAVYVRVCVYSDQKKAHSNVVQDEGEVRKENNKREKRGSERFSPNGLWGQWVGTIA